MKRALTIFCGCCCVAFALAAVLNRPARVHHQDSTAFAAALDQAVKRLENSGRTALGATAVLMNATAPAATAQGTFTMDGYTCQSATCNTYNPQQPTCDRATNCGFQHTTEPPPFDHTCQSAGVTCDGSYTCDMTVDPRAFTCDALNTQCVRETFNGNQPTCDPTRPECRYHNPGACTANPLNPTCSGVACPPLTIDPRSITCDGSPICGTPTSNPAQLTCQPGDPRCVPTCDTQNPNCQLPTVCPAQPTCDPSGATCSASFPTCVVGTPTCQSQTCAPLPTCQAPTCDPAQPTCDPAGITCSPTAPTCSPTQPTCDPSSPTCDPNGITCTAALPTCAVGQPTCQAATCSPNTTCTATEITCNPLQLTCDTTPQCHIGAERTTWGQVKEKYQPKR